MDSLFHVLEAQQFSRDVMNEIFDVTREMEHVVSRYGSNILNRRIMATLFYEPSTRTRLSFEAAMYRLGGEVITTESAREFSSAAKGETLEDTIRIVEGYSDVIVLRHYESGSARRAADAASVPIINAGDGTRTTSHAGTFGCVHNSEGDRQVRWYSRGIGRRSGKWSHGAVAGLFVDEVRRCEAVFCRASYCAYERRYQGYLTEHGVAFEEEDDLMSVMSKVDVVYQTRIQRERFGDRIEDYDRARGKYVIDVETMSALSDDAIVMHPLPRVDEIDPAVDTDPRAAYFRQAHNGVFIRMALLQMVLGV